MTILVVDDEDCVREAVAEALEMAGYAVVAAADGRQALASVDRSPPELVLLDVDLPVLDGRRVAAKLRRRGLAVPVVVMTGAAKAATVAAEMGASGFLAKPFSVDDLLCTVGALVPSLVG